MIDYLILTRELFVPEIEECADSEFYRRYGFYPEAEAEGAGDGFPFDEEEFDELEAEREMNIGPEDSCPF